MQKIPRVTRPQPPLASGAADGAEGQEDFRLAQDVDSHREDPHEHKRSLEGGGILLRLIFRDTEIAASFEALIPSADDRPTKATSFRRRGISSRRRRRVAIVFLPAMQALKFLPCPMCR